MPVPAAKVKALCTASEAARCCASRKAELEKLDGAEVKKLAILARQLRDKWRDLNRRQSRARGPKNDPHAADTNSHVKEEIFRDAHARFEERITELQKAGVSTNAEPRTNTKKHRGAEHRAACAAVRKGMTAAEDLLNAEKRRAAPRRPAPSKPVAAPAPAAPKEIAADQAAATKPAAKPAKSCPLVSAVLSKGKQQHAVAAAKQARVAKSGKTTRLRAHVKSQGKRTQARRDGK